jgi:hypothetical protein
MAPIVALSVALVVVSGLAIATDAGAVCDDGGALAPAWSAIDDACPSASTATSSRRLYLGRVSAMARCRARAGEVVRRSGPEWSFPSAGPED